MLIVPLQPVPAQELSVTLSDQVCQIRVWQKATGMFIDLYVDNALVIGGVLCENLNKIVRSAYLGFSGDLAFIDTQGSSDPDYAGLGSRFKLAYLDPTDVATADAAAVAEAAA